MKHFLVLIILFLLMTDSAVAEKPLYAVATVAIPVLNTPDFRDVFGGRDGRTLQKDRCGQIRAVEFVAFPGTVFTVEAELKKGAETIYRVTSADYPYEAAGGYFIDSRAVRTVTAKPEDRSRNLPAKQDMIATMKSRVGTGYIWGGNLAAGVPELLRWYGYPGETGEEKRRQWQLAGVDCSGLLYEATGGYTPRNTSALVSYGSGVAIAGKNADSIARLLEPLDLIVWPGHVMIVLDDNSIIESRLVCGRPDEGVRIRPAGAVVAELVKSRRPADVIGSSSREFVVRRWYRKQSGL